MRHQAITEATCHHPILVMKWGLMMTIAILATALEGAPVRARTLEESQDVAQQIRDKNQRHLDGKARIREAQEGRFWRNHL
ncbi:hypothetical protein H257_06085 [Aphanomyces astaci]|uniref:RxLR effector protein n=1 Tax=Aphanomyces astaci TaxID=112090 RepID=W4GMJ0_APHAT|nr:hypothetical protein H257_06085 [Aphanomyces astaci]ETV80551.1 hypothetical protein H257_06085 [Aphanomyces astaci]|eukprot:XP_009829498.1 hypothetical protein H257_06085 [Aphanomyces astaci]